MRRPRQEPRESQENIRVRVVRELLHDLAVQLVTNLGGLKTLLDKLLCQLSRVRQLTIAHVTENVLEQSSGLLCRYCAKIGQ